MAARGSFQKRQKEAARREKRQLKLDRRQGREHPGLRPVESDPETDTSLESRTGVESAESSPTPKPDPAL